MRIDAVAAPVFVAALLQHAFRLPACRFEHQVESVGTVDDARCTTPRWAGRAGFVQTINSGRQPRYREPHPKDSAASVSCPRELDQLAQPQSYRLSPGPANGNLESIVESIPHPRRWLFFF